MTWVSILKLLLTIVSAIASIVRERQLLDAGSKAEIAVQLAAIAQRVEATEQIRDAVESLAEGELDKELEGTDPSQ